VEDLQLMFLGQTHGVEYRIILHQTPQQILFLLHKVKHWQTVMLEIVQNYRLLAEQWWLDQ
jgi:hypothetical protein